MSQTVRFEKQDSIAIVTIDRPEALNALNGDVIAELEQVVTALEKARLSPLGLKAKAAV